MNNTIVTRVVLHFIGSDSQEYTMSINDVRNPVTQESTEAAMQQISIANAFFRGDTNLYAEVLGAQTITTTTSTLFQLG